MFACNAGYAIDPTIGSILSCNNGMWSTRPRCLSEFLSIQLHHLSRVFAFVQELVDAR